MGATVVNKLKSYITIQIPKIFDAVFECTLDMINKDFEEHPEHRTNFFTTWKLVPDTLYLQTPVPPSLNYGGVHLARLLVKLPEIMIKMKLSMKNAKKIIKYLEYLTEFLNNQ